MNAHGESSYGTAGSRNIDMEQQVRQYTACLFEAEDIVEIRILPQKYQQWCQAVELIDHYEQWRETSKQGQNIYVGLNPRSSRGGSRSEDVRLARCLVADFDNAAPSQAQTIIEQKGLPQPTLLVASGHGVHAYWRLCEPLEDLSRWSEIQRRLAEHLGADRAVCDAPRLMRLPGTINQKDPGNPVLCFIVHAESRRQYPLEQLAGQLELGQREQQDSEPSLPQVGSSSNQIVERARRYLEQVPGKEQGQRSTQAFRLAAALQILAKVVNPF